MRFILLGLGILGMVGGALAGLVIGSDVHADVAAMKNATLRNDVSGYNGAVEKYNRDVQTRGYAFGAVIVGALFLAATAGYDIMQKRRAA